MWLMELMFLIVLTKPTTQALITQPQIMKLKEMTLTNSKSHAVIITKKELGMNSLYVVTLVLSFFHQESVEREIYSGQARNHLLSLDQSGQDFLT